MSEGYYGSPRTSRYGVKFIWTESRLGPYPVDENDVGNAHTFPISILRREDRIRFESLLGYPMLLPKFLIGTGERILFRFRRD